MSRSPLLNKMFASVRLALGARNPLTKRVLGPTRPHLEKTAHGPSRRKLSNLVASHLDDELESWRAASAADLTVRRVLPLMLGDDHPMTSLFRELPDLGTVRISKKSREAAEQWLGRGPAYDALLLQCGIHPDSAQPWNAHADALLDMLEGWWDFADLPSWSYGSSGVLAQTVRSFIGAWPVAIPAERCVALELALREELRDEGVASPRLDDQHWHEVTAHSVVMAVTVTAESRSSFLPWSWLRELLLHLACPQSRCVRHPDCLEHPELGQACFADTLAGLPPIEGEA